MLVAIWIIAICEVIRAAQNMMQITMVLRDTKARDNCYAEFVKSLKDTDKDFVRKMLEEFEKDSKDAGNPVIGAKLNDDGSWSGENDE